MATVERRTTGSTRGVFAEMDDASRAVRMLLENSVPADTIRVLLMDTRGETVRELPVEDEAGALRGAFIGAAIGAALGVIIVGVGAAFVLRSDAAIGVPSLVGAFAAIAATTAACIPLGALWGTGHWRGGAKLTPKDREADRVAVVVQSDALVPLPGNVMAEAGAIAVTGPSS